jgi:hypothetical protein
MPLANHAARRHISIVYPVTVTPKHIVAAACARAYKELHFFFESWTMKKQSPKQKLSAGCWFQIDTEVAFNVNNCRW